MARAGVTFVPNPFFEEEIRASDGMRRVMEEVSSEVAADYRASVRANAYDTGDLFDSIESDVLLDSRGWVGRVAGVDWKARITEFGTSRIPPDGSLRRAVETNGLELEEPTTS